MGSEKWYPWYGCGENWGDGSNKLLDPSEKVREINIY